MSTMLAEEPAVSGNAGETGRIVGALQAHWPEYLIEAAGLGLFMISAGLFATLFEYPGSPVHQLIPDAAIRRALMGAAMGSTAIALIYSKWGMRSGAHFNPATTLVFYRLGKIEPEDAVFYALFQFLGALAGVLLMAAILGQPFRDPPVEYVGTLPMAGMIAAFAAELVISGLLMTVVLNATNTKRLHRFTGLFAGALVALYIAVESPISGMSMNPARSFGSLAVAGLWNLLWIYFIAPPVGMLIAAEVHLRTNRPPVMCAKYHHENGERCIFRCGYAAEAAARDTTGSTHGTNE
jgi:aquaporin Z